MNFNNFTIKSQEVVQKAIELTRQNGQQQIEPVHILKALIQESETIVNFVFQKLGANLNSVNMAIDKDIQSLPKVSGGEVFLSRESNDALQKERKIKIFKIYFDEWKSRHPAAFLRDGMSYDSRKRGRSCHCL